MDLAKQVDQLDEDRDIQVIRGMAEIDLMRATTKHIVAKASVYSALALAITLLALIAVGAAVFAVVHW